MQNIRTVREVREKMKSSNEFEVVIPMRQLRSTLNEFKKSTESAFHRLSSDISNLGRSTNFPTDPNTIRITFEELQKQLKHIRDSFHAFNFGVEDPVVSTNEIVSAPHDFTMEMKSKSARS